MSLEYPNRGIKDLFDPRTSNILGTGRRILNRAEQEAAAVQKILDAFADAIENAVRTAQPGTRGV